MPRKEKTYSPRLVASYFTFYDPILRQPGISLADAAVFSLLASLQKGTPQSNPTQDYIATRLNLSRRSVIRSIHTLESQGFIAVHRFTTDNGKTHNTYVANSQLLEDLKSSRYSLRKQQSKAVRQSVQRQLDRCDKLAHPPPPKTQNSAM